MGMAEKTASDREQELKLAAMPLAVRVPTFLEAKLVEMDADEMRRLLRSGTVPKSAAYKSGKYWFLRPRAFLHWFENRR